MKPDYSIPFPALIDLITSVLLRQRRVFRLDASRLAALRGFPARIEGCENIPLTGPAVITVNHYCSPTFWSPWIAISVSAQVPVDIFWTMTDAWTYPRRRLMRQRRYLSHLLLTNLARVYGFNTMPPMPPAINEIAERTSSVMRLMHFARSNPRAVIGLAPEGGDQPGGILSLPPSGTGKLSLALARMGMPFYPAGIYEDSNGQLNLCFGPPYRLEIPASAARHDIDLYTRQQMMQAIASCLPQRLRGPFDGS